MPSIENEQNQFLVSVVEVTNLEVRVGTASTLSCTVKGISDPVTISWLGFIPGEHFSVENGVLQSGRQTGKLTISEKMVLVDKQYDCQVSNGKATQTIPVNLEVYGKSYNS